MSSLGPPLRLSAESTTETIAELRWSKPVDDGGGDIIGYQIDRKLEGVLTGFLNLLGGLGYKVAPTVKIITASDGSLISPFSGDIFPGFDFEIGDKIILPLPNLNIINSIQATAEVSSVSPLGQITGVLVTEPGNGYSGTTVTSTDIESVNGKTGQVIFDLVKQTGAGATATTTLDLFGQVVSIDITDSGSGYTAGPPIVVINSPVTGEQAEAEAVLVGEQVESVIIKKGGSGYTADPLVDIAIPPPTGMQATATSNISLTTAGVKNISVVLQGNGYEFLFPPLVEIAPPKIGSELLVPFSGVIFAGFDYKVNSVIFLPPPDLDIVSPVQATAHVSAIINFGEIDGVEVDNPGNGYSGTTVTSTDIEDGSNGVVEFNLIPKSAATANAVISDDSFATLVDDTGSTETAFTDTTLFPRNNPTYLVKAINDQ